MAKSPKEGGDLVACTVIGRQNVVCSSEHFEEYSHIIYRNPVLTIFLKDFTVESSQAEILDIG